jgi:DNA polymerase
MNPRYKNIAFLDFESYYDTKSGFSLAKMPTINYVRDPRFKSFGCSVGWNNDPMVYLTHEEFIDWAESVDWSSTAVCAHNCQFDACVLTQHYNIYAAYYICTQAVSQALLPIDSVALKRVAPLLGLGEKTNALVDGATESNDGMADYANNDNLLAKGIFETLYPMLSQDEQDLIHLHIRQAVEPSLVLDIDVLKQVRDDAAASRLAAIEASGYTDAELTSNQKFAKIIKDLGLQAPTKLSETTGEEVEAFAKGDDEFVEFMLQYPEYKHIWDGRLAAKSNINVSRAEKFLSIAELNPLVPMPLKYCGAHTGRSSGADGLNVQNLPNTYKSNMRKAFTAPKGQVIVVVDSAQIELRVNMWLAGQEDKLEILASGGDIYKVEAASQFNISVDEVSKDQRQYGKLCQLGLGYGMGANKFRKTAAAGPLGMDPIYMTMDEAYNTVTSYRAGNYKIPQLWRSLDERIHQMTLPGLNEVDGVLTFVHEGIVLPSGRMLQYPGLHQTEEGQWVYGIDKKVKFLWGGTMDENIVQALARDIVFYQMLEIDKQYRVVSSTHDEVLYLANEDEAEEALAFGIAILSQSPSWAPDLPVSAEGGYDVCYSK